MKQRGDPAVLNYTDTTDSWENTQTPQTPEKSMITLLKCYRKCTDSRENAQTVWKRE
jgi:hypothetical protein